MGNAIDHEKKDKFDRAAQMGKVPLSQLIRLIKERQVAAQAKYIDGVEYYNKLIMQLLAL